MPLIRIDLDYGNDDDHRDLGSLSRNCQPPFSRNMLRILVTADTNSVRFKKYQQILNANTTTT